MRLVPMAVIHRLKKNKALDAALSPVYMSPNTS
jgi:hypothetical protein